MFNFKNKKTLYITIGVGIVLIIILWLMFSGRSSNQADSTLIAVASDPVELIIGREMLIALDQMKSTKLDVSFFADPAYKSLEDFTVEIPEQPVGRRDPFSPI